MNEAAMMESILLDTMGQRTLSHMYCCMGGRGAASDGAASLSPKAVANATGEDNEFSERGDSAECWEDCIENCDMSGLSGRRGADMLAS